MLHMAWKTITCTIINPWFCVNFAFQLEHMVSQLWKLYLLCVPSWLNFKQCPHLET